jgi:PAS domain S-box-containing protein
MGEERVGEDLVPGPVEASALPGIGECLLRALEESPIGTAVGGSDGRWIRVNRAFAEILGYAPEELVGLEFRDVTHPADLDIDVENQRKLARGEIKNYQRAKRYVRKDGSIVFVRLSVSILRDRDGAFVGHLAQVEDITERMRADEALRKSEANFRRLFDQASVGIFISDLDGRHTDVNAAACEMLGFAREELLGKTITDFLPMEDALKLAKDRELLLVPGSIQVQEWTPKRKDGTLISVEVSTKFLPDGRQVAFVRDISEQKRAAREREESLRWVKAVLDQSPVGLLLVHGPNVCRVRVNSRLQQMIGAPIQSVDELRGKFSTPDGEPVDHDNCACMRAMRGEWPGDRELLLHDVRGGTTPVFTSCAPIMGADGSVLGVVVAVQDIAATKELERLRAEWSSVVAHDLRQPLGTVLLNAQLLAHVTDEGRPRLHVERIRSAAQRLNRMVDDLMDLSRLDARRLELVRRSVDMAALVRASVERMALEAPDRPFDLHVDGDIPKADVDPDRVAQVMENLLTNAVKYGTDGTPIVVAVERDSSEISVAVTNDGRALAPEELSRLFQRFQRTPSARLQGINGTGLGLYITRSLVEAHGGRIAADSSPPGRITFRFTLPAAELAT